jgi:hypothetical protein
MRGYYHATLVAVDDDLVTNSTVSSDPCRAYKSEMSKIIERWLLFQYVGFEFTPLSKPLKTREQA